MNHYGLFTLILCCCLGAAALVCGCTESESADPNVVSKSGTVVYHNLEGGFYGIIADDGASYLPLNLPDECAQDNLLVTFTGIIRSDVATIQQWGTPIELTEISSNGQMMKIVSTGD
jgi:hypothetical protein